MTGVFVVGVAAQFSIAQLWNPLGSGVNLILEQCSAYAAANCGIELRPVTATAGALIGPGLSKKNGGATSAARLYGGVIAAVPVASAWASGILLANTPFPLSMREPIVLAPNTGAIIYATITAGNNLTANFEWFEEAI